MKAAGAVLLFFWALQARNRYACGKSVEMLWNCNVATFSVAVGSLLRWDRAISVGLLVAMLGFSMWIIGLITGIEVTLPSLVTHPATVIVGFLGVRSCGIPAGSWWQAWLVIVGLHMLCRVASPRELNVNLAHAIWPGFDRYFSSHRTYVLFLVALYFVFLFVVEAALRRYLGLDWLR